MMGPEEEEDIVTVTLTAAEGRDVFPAASVSFPVMLCVPLDNADETTDQVPVLVAVVVAIGVRLVPS